MNTGTADHVADPSSPPLPATRCGLYSAVSTRAQQNDTLLACSKIICYYYCVAVVPAVRRSRPVDDAGVAASLQDHSHKRDDFCKLIFVAPVDRCITYVRIQSLKIYCSGIDLPIPHLF